MKRLAFLFGLQLFMLWAVVGCENNDDDNDAADDDDDSDDDDDDNDNDDDNNDDNNNDDNDTSPGLYDDLAPTGPPLSALWGVSSHIPGGSTPRWERDFEASQLVEAGIWRIRRDFIWSVIEPQNDVWQWDDTDALYQLAFDPGLVWDALLVYGVDWAMPGGSHSEIPPEEYGEFAGQVAARYCDAIKTYEAWNEENLGGRFWLPDNDPVHYGLMLKAAYQAVKAACPDAEVVFGGMSTFDLPSVAFRGVYYFFDQVAQAHPDICDYFDVMAIHPYTIAQQPRPELDVKLLTFDYPDISGQVEVIRERMAAAGCGDRPVYFTEMGWPSYLIQNGNQARYLVRGALLAARIGVTGYYWYTFWDGRGATPITEDYFGLYEYPYDHPPEEQVPKESYFAYQAMSTILGDARYAGDLSPALGLADDAYVLAFLDEAANRLVLTLWNGGWPPAAIPLTLPTPENATALAAYNLYGEPLAIDLAPEIKVDLKLDVTYLKFTLEP
jgi:hypothetical protein